ncbi:MAG TPA: DUF637 domain-containing protein [Cellvibrionaceae bacterium]
MKPQIELTPVKLSKRITGWFLIGLTLFNTLFTAYAQAANLVSTSSIISDLANNYEFEAASAYKPYLYQKATYISAQGTVNNQTLETFHAKIVQNKIALPAKQWLPIAGDITLFIPHYPIGKIMGDGYVQNRYIRAQIYNQLGRHLIDSALYSDEATQANALYNNAYTFAQTQGARIPFGTPLASSEAVAADMIWPEYRDINGQKVLVPIVYLTQTTIDAQRVKGHVINLGASTSLKALDATGVDLKTRRDAMITTMGDLSLNKATISTLGNLALIVRGTLNNINGSISATDLLNINALQLINNGGTLSAGSINIDKTGIVQNVSGTIQAAGNVRIIAGEIISKPVVYQFKDKNGSGTRLGTVASINSQNGNIELETLKNAYANGDITIQGATVNATNGAITFNAANNINISAISTQYQTTYRDGDWEVNQSNINLLQSRLNAKETIKLIAGGTINITASELISTAGGIELLAEQGIYILDELTQEQIQRVDRKGKTTGQSSEFRTEAVRAVLRAGKGILLDSAHGDVVLKASKLSSTNGAQVYARDGKVRMLMTKELEEFHLNTVKKGTWTIKTRTEDVINETNIQNAIVGGFQVQAQYGVDVEYTGKDGATLREQIEEFRHIPEMKWMADLYDQALTQAGPNLNWNELEEIHKELKKTKKNLSPAAMAIIAIAVAVVTAGAGAALIGAAQGTLSAAVANAAVTTLATQAAQSLAAGNSPSATLKSMGSSESLKSLAVSMVTAGALQNTNIEMFSKAADSKNLAVSLAGQAGQAVVNATVTAGISVAINGGSTDDFKKAFTASLAANAINTIGQRMADKISGAASLNDVGKYISHATMGCLTQGLTAKLSDADAQDACLSGAGGAVIAQGVADLVQSKTNQLTTAVLNNTPDNNAANIASTLNYLANNGADVSKLIAAFAAFATKGDVYAAAGAAGTVAVSYRQNMLQAANVSAAVQQMGLAECGGLTIAACGNKTLETMLREKFKANGRSDQEIESAITFYKTKTPLFNTFGESVQSFLETKGSLTGIIPSVKLDGTSTGSTTGVDGIDLVTVTGEKWGIVRQGINDLVVTAGIAQTAVDDAIGEGLGYILNSPIGVPIKWGTSMIYEKGVKVALAKYPELGTVESLLNEANSFAGIGALSVLDGNTYSDTKIFLDGQPSAYNADFLQEQKYAVAGFAAVAALLGGAAVTYFSKATKLASLPSVNDGRTDWEMVGQPSQFLPINSTRLTRRPGTLSGEPEAIGPTFDADKKRSITRQNEATELLSQFGLNIERLPESNAQGVKNPDLKINGEVADVYSPGGKNPQTIGERIEQKVAEGQANNIVVNLADSISPEAVLYYLDYRPVPGLKDLYLLKGNDVIKVKF